MTKEIVFSQQDCEVVKRELLYQGAFRLTKLHLRHRLFKGGWSDIFTREILERSPAAAVLPYDPVLDRVILIEQFRPGALNHSRGPWQIEIPAGVFNSDEDPFEAATREAKEEANCTLTHLELIYDYLASPGAMNESVYIFWGKVDSRNINGVHGLPEEHEDIRVLNLSADEALTKLHRGEIKNAPAIMALQWLELNRSKLRL